MISRQFRIKYFRPLTEIFFMKIANSFSILLALTTLSVQGYAQSGLEGLSTGRYISVPAPKKSTAVKAKPRTVASEEKSMEIPVVVKTEEKSSQVVPPPPATSPAVAETDEPGLAEQAQGLFSAKTEPIYNFYREQVHPDDVRNNQIEIEFSPTTVYNESTSNYSVREYNSYFTALKVKAGLWLTPMIGLSGQMLFSLGSDIDALDNSRSKVTTKYDNLDLSLNFRKFFGLSRRANSVETSLLYSDYKFSPASDSTTRLKTKTTGLGLGVKVRFPTSASYAWTLGGSFFPRLKHDESSNVPPRESGASSENSRVGLELGGEFKFSRESQMIWSLGMTSEKNMFDGAAFSADPVTGTTPSRVSVTNSMYLFSLGYRWGH